MKMKNSTPPKRSPKSPKVHHFAEPHHFDAVLGLYELAMRAEWVLYSHPDGYDHPENGPLSVHLWIGVSAALQCFEQESDETCILHQAALDLQTALFVDNRENEELSAAAGAFSAKAKAIKDDAETASRLSRVSFLLQAHAGNIYCYSEMAASRKALKG